VTAFFDENSPNLPRSFIDTMCGIAGTLDLHGGSADRAEIQAMTAVLAHRGPDHSAVYTSGPVGLGYVRLSIVDLSDAGNQPMTDETGNWVGVYNGEIYNFLELRKELEQQGVRFRSSTDTEVLMNLFARQGLAGISRLNGMFGFAIWSKQDRQLWLFRDPLGVKPVYYRVANERLSFASEIKAIRAIEDGVSEMDPTGLLNYLTFGHALAPTTIFRGISKLPPGHYLCAKEGQVRVERYFDFPLPITGESRRPHEWVEEADAVLRAAVKRQMAADVPVGVFLSGGIDSSLVTGYMAEQSVKVQSFSICFPGSPKYDEGGDARLVSQHLGTEHREVHIKPDDLISAAGIMVYHYDEPFADAAGALVYMVSKLARQHVKVSLSGEGGDEMFGGYRRYSAERFARFYRGLPASIRALAIRAAASRGRARRVNRAVRALNIPDDASRYAGWLEVFSPDALGWLLNGAYGRALESFDGAAGYRSLFRNCPDADTLGRVSYADAQTWLPDTYLEKVDKASMAVSLEVRVPMLDLEVVRFAARCPSRMKLRGFTGKYVLRQVAKSRLPAAIGSKPKHGLSVPMDPWFRGRLKNYVHDILLDKVTLRRGLFSRAGLEQLLYRHASGQENCETQIWTLLMLELWMRQALDRQPASRAAVTV
jgi:asparagine synthase (glutamine-hydrolysing)